MRLPHSSRDLTDYLTANEEFRRSLRLSIRTTALLRQGGARQQARKQARYLEEARDQIREQMLRARRRAFRGHVSVELTIFAGGVSEPPSAPKSVKRYLDAMSRLAYHDDRQIDHLVVQRFADDHPHLRRKQGREEDLELPVATNAGHSEPWVGITVTPLRIYTADFDRAFRLHDDHDYVRDADRDDLRFWKEEDSHDSGIEVERLLEEREDDANDRGLYALLDPESRANARRFREWMLDRLLTEEILSRRPSIWDRPGADPYAYLGVLAPGSDLVHGRLSLPGEFWVPGPEEGRWDEAVRCHLEAHRARWPVLPAAFDEPLALDIAAFGVAGQHRDVDNIAHPILVAFEELFCADRRGTVTGYRTYRMTGDRSGVRVQLMPGGRLNELQAAIAGARAYVLSRGPVS